MKLTNSAKTLLAAAIEDQGSDSIESTMLNSPEQIVDPLLLSKSWDEMLPEEREHIETEIEFFIKTLIKK